MTRISWPWPWSRPWPGAVVLALVLVGLATLAGCDGTPPVSTSMTEATVKGTVTIRGKKASSGTVVFDPTNIKRRDVAARRAEIRNDGTYEIVTLVGDNTISVAGPSFDRDDQVGTAQLTLDVPAGESTFDIVLPRQ